MPTLHWIGKDRVINHHQDVPFRLLDHQYGAHADGTQTAEPTGSGNHIIHGDNLEALKALLPQYEGRVKCIYIDPPYNTGNEGWVYNDNVSDPKLRKWLGQVVGKESEDLSRHDKWLCMMYPRLKLLHKLLAEDGSIWISIDDNELYNLKQICDEIMGGGNFLGNIIWQHSIQGKNDVKTISLHHNNTLVYCKPSFQIKKLARTTEHNKAYSNSDNDPRGLWRSGDFRSPNYRENLRYDLVTPSGKIIAPPEKGWRWEKKTLAKKIDDKEVVFNSDETKITRKIYLEAQEGRVIESIWFGNEVGTTRDANRLLKELFDAEVPFNTPKPVELLERILEIATDKDSIVLDSFAGSGTTAHAVLKLNQQDGGNRRFILTEMEDYAEHITAERVKRVMRGYAGQPGLGGNFDFLTLGEPVFTDTGELNERASLPGLRQYIYYAETRQHLPPSPSPAPDNAAFLALHADTAYYFHYEPQAVTTLSHDFLSTMRTRASQYIIYADNCLLPSEFMALHGIIFKKIPRDISRF